MEKLDPKQEAAAILCGLRMVQASLDGDFHGARCCDHFDEVETPTSEQLDDLCERINTEIEGYGS